MNLDIVSGVPIPASTKVGNTNPEYKAVADKLKAMNLGDSFPTTLEDAKKVRYIATRVGVTLTSRTVDPNTVRFWRVEPRPKKVAASAADVIA